jgi:DNA repair protein RadC
VFGVLFLDSQHRVRFTEELFTGTIDAASIYPREVVKASLQRNTTAVIFS